MKIQRRQYQEGEIRRRDRQAKMEAIATSEAYTLSMETQTRGWASDEFYTKVQIDNGFYNKAFIDANIYTKVQSDGFYLRKANNLSDLANPATSRTNLGLGDSATRNVGTSTGTVADGGVVNSHITNTSNPHNVTPAQIGALTQAVADTRYPLKSNNLSDLSNAGTARTNLGLGNSAIRDVGTSSGTVMAGDGAYTKSDSDNRYYQRSQTYTQSEVNNLINGFMTQAQGDARYNRLASDNAWTARNFMPNGSNGSPSMAYSGSTNTGFYAPANGGLAISVGGSQIAHWRMNGSTMQMGFFGVTPVPRQSITGLLSILNLSIFNTMVQAGVNLGLWTDNRIL